MRITLAALLLLFTTPAFAELEVRFREGAPKDRFTISNRAACPVADTVLTIDLEGSAAALIFDTTGAGAGVEVFQPFAVVEGRDALASEPVVRDGDRAIALPIRFLAPGGRIAFTIDVDDTVEKRGITVSDSEIRGASVRLEGRSGTFRNGPVARVQTPACD